MSGLLERLGSLNPPIPESQSDNMKIIYLGNFDKPLTDNTEKHIKYALEQLGHEVIPIDEKGFLEVSDDGYGRKADAEILSVKNPDLFLFHKGGIGNRTSPETLALLIKLLSHLTCTKVCWYFDKVFPDREEYIELVSAYCEYVFLTDDTFIRRHKFKNLHCLRQGIGNEDMSLGKYRKEYDYNVVFTGNAYESRNQLVRLLGMRYGKKFKAFNDAFNRDLYDLCASAKIFVAPFYPSDEFYWSSRIYMTLGSGGFLVHPDLYGLRDEFTEGTHFAGYKDEREMIKTIDYYLKHEEQRKDIQEAGYEYCIEMFTYKDRVQQMLDKINEKT